MNRWFLMSGFRQAMPVLYALALALAQSAAAQNYPTRTVRIIVPTAPGGSIDTTARITSAKLAELWGQQVVVENRAGASMIIGADAVAKSAPDGYTMLVAHDGTLAMNPVVFPNLPYSPPKDFAPISLLTVIPLVILVNSKVQASSLQDLLAMIRANPGKLNHASGGTATLLAAELLKAMAKIDFQDVPYKGGAPAVAGAAAGETHFTIADLATGNAGMRSGKVRPVAVTTLERAKSRPELPTAAESGVPGYETRTWIGVLAPASTPADIVGKISADFQRVLAMPDVRARLEALAMEVQRGTAEELAQVMRTDTEKWGRLIKERGIRLGK